MKGAKTQFHRRVRKTIFPHHRLADAQVGLEEEENDPEDGQKRLDFSPAQPWRAETRLVQKAAVLLVTIVSRFAPHLSRFLRAKRERSWRTFSASC